MNWILDNLEKLVPAVIALLYFLGSSKVKKAEQGREAADPGSNERARRIQEEIRRKILERQQQGEPVVRSRPSPPPLASEPEFEGRYDPFESELVREREEADAYPRPEAVLIEEEDLYETQRKQIEEQMQKARELQKQVHSARKKLPAAPLASTGLQRTGDLRADLRRDLKDIGSIRRALVLKEILDIPLALR